MKRISTKGNVEQEVLGVGAEQQDGLGLLCPCFQPPAMPDINYCAAQKCTSRLLWGLSHHLQVRSGQWIKPKTDQTLQNHNCSRLPWSMLHWYKHILIQAKDFCLQQCNQLAQSINGLLCFAIIPSPTPGCMTTLPLCCLFVMAQIRMKFQG